MAHFAKLDENNIVTEVIVVANGDLLDEDGNESEQKGVEFCQSLFGKDTKWVQTSYNNNFRSKYAGPGFYYDSEKDIFVPPKPFSSWIYNEETNRWDPPIPIPIGGDDYFWVWDEENLRWKVQYFPLEQPPKPIQPFESWIWNGTEWEAPVPYPTTGYSYIWNESTKEWDQI